MTPKKWLGLALGFLAFLPEFTQIGFGNLFAHAAPRIITFGAVISSTYGWIVLKALVNKGYSPIFVNGIGMFLGGIIALITSYYTESWIPSPVTQWVPFIQATLLIIVVANILFYNLYGYLLKFYTATFLSLAGFMCPLFTAILGYFFLGEGFSSKLIFSSIMVALALFIFYYEELKQGYINEHLS